MIPIAALNRMPDDLADLMCQVPPAAYDWKPKSWDGIPGETFSIREQLCHLRDIEIDGYQIRFARVRRESRPFLESIDGYALVETRGYADADPTVVMSAFRAARERTIAMLADVNAEALTRAGVFEGYGPVSLAGLVRFLCSHDQQHLACIHWLLGKFHSERAETD